MSAEEIKRTEEEAKKIIANMEGEMLAETDKCRLTALKSIVYVLEDNWNILITEMIERLKT